MTVRDNDWPTEVKGLRRVPAEEARNLKHDVPPGLDVDKREHPRQLTKERRTPPPFAHLDDEDDE